MVAQDATTVVFIPQVAGSGVGLYTATVTSADTVTLSDFNDIINWYVIDLSDNSEATATQGTNILTITEGGLVTQKILIYAQGT